MRRSRTVRVAVTPDEKAAIKDRASAHGEPVSAYLRRVALTRRVGAGGGVDADAMWDSLPQERKDQIARWLLGHDNGPRPLPGQMALTDDGIL